MNDRLAKIYRSRAMWFAVKDWARQSIFVSIPTRDHYPDWYGDPLRRLFGSSIRHPLWRYCQGGCISRFSTDYTTGRGRILHKFRSCPTMLCPFMVRTDVPLRVKAPTLLTTILYCSHALRSASRRRDTYPKSRSLWFDERPDKDSLDFGVIPRLLGSLVISP